MSSPTLTREQVRIMSTAKSSHPQRRYWWAHLFLTVGGLIMVFPSSTRC